MSGASVQRLVLPSKMRVLAMPPNSTRPTPSGRASGFMAPDPPPHAHVADAPTSSTTVPSRDADRSRCRRERRLSRRGWTTIVLIIALHLFMSPTPLVDQFHVRLLRI